MLEPTEEFRTRLRAELTAEAAGDVVVVLDSAPPASRRPATTR